jgi:hypothetical protein
MRTDANGCTEQMSFDMVPLEAISEEPSEEDSMILYARRLDTNTIELFLDPECTQFWSWAEDSKLQRKVLAQTPFYYFTNEHMYTFDKVEWVDNG